MADAPDVRGVGRAVSRVLDDERWLTGSHKAIVLGAGGAGLSLALNLVERLPELGARHVVLTDADPRRLAIAQDLSRRWARAETLEIIAATEDANDRLVGTALPGTPGNVGIAAHRDGYFRALKDIKKGDELVLETPAATEQYRVEWIKITVPTDVNVIGATPGPAVTLVGCYPFYHQGPAPQRFIVRAVPVTVSTTTAPPSGS
jgi:sortase A